MSASVPPVQTSPEWIIGSPEGVVYGPPGYEVVDSVSGARWIKSTPITQNTGWRAVITGGAFIGLDSDPVADPGVDFAIAINRLAGSFWYWNGSQWIKLIA